MGSKQRKLLLCGKLPLSHPHGQKKSPKYTNNGQKDRIEDGNSSKNLSGFLRAGTKNIKFDSLRTHTCKKARQSCVLKKPNRVTPPTPILFIRKKFFAWGLGEKHSRALLPHHSSGCEYHYQMMYEVSLFDIKNFLSHTQSQSFPLLFKLSCMEQIGS